MATMIEKKMNSIIKEIEKLNKSLERHQGLLQKKIEKCEKLNCNWTKEEQPCTLMDERMTEGNAGELISNYSTHKEGILQPFEARVILSYT